MSKAVFVSHATKDIPLVRALVDLIEDGLGVPESEIFCSSLPGLGIPAGENFVTFMKSQISEPKIVVLVLSRNYLSSHFCLSELGASWVKSHKIFPIIVEPLSYADVKDVLLGTQVVKVGDDIGYNGLKEYLGEIGLINKSDTKWDIKRKAFIEKLPSILKEIPDVDIVDIATYQALEEKVRKFEEELLNYEAQADQYKELIDRLEKIKDAEEVKKVKSEFSATDNIERFKQLTEDISELKYNLGGDEILKFALAQYYDLPYSMDYHNFRNEFEEAALKRIVDLENKTVIWDSSRPKKLRALLKELDELLSYDEIDEEISAHFSNKDVPIESDNLEFWREFYGMY